MIIAREQLTGRLVSKITNKAAVGGVTIRLQTVTAASMPSRLTIKTNEAQLRGPPGGIGQVVFETNPLVYFLMELG